MAMNRDGRRDLRAEHRLGRDHPLQPADLPDTLARSSSHPSTSQPANRTAPARRASLSRPAWGAW